MFATILVAASFLFFPGDERLYLERIERLHTENGLFVDRQSDRSTVSVAATGLGILALAEATTRGERDRQGTIELAWKAFRTTLAGNLPQNRGWLSHFTDPDGKPKSYSEISTIDTAIFYAGLLEASRRLEEPALELAIRVSMAKIDRSLVMREGVFLHGFYWDYPHDDPSLLPIDAAPRLIPYRWDDSSEGVILYRLFELPFPLKITRDDYPLFVYAYPLCFFDDPMYEQLLGVAIERQICDYGYWGVTSTDGPSGYVTYDRNIISPVLIGAVAAKFPHYLESLKDFQIPVGVGALDLSTGWVTHDDLTIDLASAYALFSRWSRQIYAKELAQEEGTSLNVQPIEPNRIDPQETQLIAAP
jgi:hypothetical protein